MSILPNVMNTGRSGMVAAKAAVATAGHNVANANTEGYSRQRVETKTDTPQSIGAHAYVGTGTLVSRVDRINDEYIEKQVRNAGRDMAHMEEKELILKQTEDIFNEMGGDGLNRIMSKFFNDFRKLANEPENTAIRQSIRESSQSMINDFHRMRNEVEEVRRHIDSRLEGHAAEVNALATEVRDLNMKIKQMELSGAPPNDLMDRRDQSLKKLGAFMDINVHKDEKGSVTVDIKGVGPLVAGPTVESFSVFRSPADDQGKPDNALDLKTTASVTGSVTHQIKGGKIGALLTTRDSTLSTILDRLDELAMTVSDSVNAIHSQGFNAEGQQGLNFFKPVDQKERASSFIELSDEVKDNINNIATAAIPDAPGDNRIAIAISGLQSMKLMNNGKSTVDDFYNSIVSDVGVATNRNRTSMNQQKDIQTQLGKMRDQISGVSIDEETANLLQFHHAFEASAKVIQVADEMLKTVLDLKR
ncbi:MAG: flagellar hook-associated protein FlgK [Methylotenera sp.]|nr:flagellar hook-associated protein FlgK [Oligoflexia bacterium]